MNTRAHTAYRQQQQQRSAQMCVSLRTRFPPYFSHTVSENEGNVRDTHTPTISLQYAFCSNWTF